MPKARASKRPLPNFNDINWGGLMSFVAQIGTPPPNPNCRIRPRVLIPNEESEIEFCRLNDVHDADEVNGDQGGDSTFILEDFEKPEAPPGPSGHQEMSKVTPKKKWRLVYSDKALNPQHQIATPRPEKGRGHPEKSASNESNKKWKLFRKLEQSAPLSDEGLDVENTEGEENLDGSNIEKNSSKRERGRQSETPTGVIVVEEAKNVIKKQKLSFQQQEEQPPQPGPDVVVEVESHPSSSQSAVATGKENEEPLKTKKVNLGTSVAQNGLHRTGQRHQKKSPKQIEEKEIRGNGKKATIVRKSAKPIIFQPQILSSKIVEQQQTWNKQKAQTGRKKRSIVIVPELTWNKQRAQTVRKKKSNIIVPELLSTETLSKKKVSTMKENFESESSFSVEKPAEPSK